MKCGLKLRNAGDRNRCIGGVVKHLRPLDCGVACSSCDYI